MGDYWGLLGPHGPKSVDGDWRPPRLVTAPNQPMATGGRLSPVMAPKHLLAAGPLRSAPGVLTRENTENVTWKSTTLALGAHLLWVQVQGVPGSTCRERRLS